MPGYQPLPVPVQFRVLLWASRWVRADFMETPIQTTHGNAKKRTARMHTLTNPSENERIKSIPHDFLVFVGRDVSSAVTAKVNVMERVK